MTPPPMTPLNLFLYGLAFAGSLGVAGLVLLFLAFLFLSVIAPPHGEDGEGEEAAPKSPLLSRPAPWPKPPSGYRESESK